VKLKKCKCGCGQNVKGENSVYCRGHNPKMQTVIYHDDKPLCKCGCGQRVTLSFNKYVHGHNQRGKKLSNMSRLLISKKLKGVSLSDERRNNISINTKKSLASWEKRQKMSNSARQSMTKERRKRISLCVKELWANDEYRKHMTQIRRNLWMNEKFKEKQIKVLADSRKKRPTSIEKKLIELNKIYDIDLEYVGDGKTWINCMNPDFINFKKKKIVELFGSYWHKKCDKKRRTNHFKKYGFDCLVVWDYEMINEIQLMKRIGGFLNEA